MQYNFNKVEIKNDISFVERKMVEAFGATLTNSAGSSFSSRLEKNMGKIRFDERKDLSSARRFSWKTVHC